MLWQLRDAPGQPTLKAFQASARGTLPFVSVKDGSQKAELAAAAAAASSAKQDSQPSQVAQRLSFSQSSSHDEDLSQQDVSQGALPVPSSNRRQHDHASDWTSVQQLSPAKRQRLDKPSGDPPSSVHLHAPGFKPGVSGNQSGFDEGGLPKDSAHADRSISVCQHSASPPARALGSGHDRPSVNEETGDSNRPLEHVQQAHTWQTQPEGCPAPKGMPSPTLPLLPIAELGPSEYSTAAQPATAQQYGMPDQDMPDSETAWEAAAGHGAHQHVDSLEGKDPSHRMEPDVSEAMGRDGSTRDTEGPGNEGADDAGMARARRLAAAARAACDVLRGPVRSARFLPRCMSPD